MALRGVPVREETVSRCIIVLEEAKVLYRCPRFDMKSRHSLQREQKYYLADLGFYFALNTDNRINYGPVFESVVYAYARAHGYSVSVGRVGKLECDFILRRGVQDYSYVQVAYSIAERSAEEREYASLERARDSYPKYLLTCDRLLQKCSGVIHENLVRFVSEEKRFGMELRGAMQAPPPAPRWHYDKLALSAAARRIRGFVQGYRLRVRPGATICRTCTAYRCSRAL